MARDDRGRARRSPVRRLGRDERDDRDDARGPGLNAGEGGVQRGLPGVGQVAFGAAELVGAHTVIPCHYDTFPPVETDVQAFKAEVEAAGHAQVVVLEVNGTHTA